MADPRSTVELTIFYQNQLNKFCKLGIGKKTEFNTKVTSKLIAITQSRLDVLSNKLCK